MATRVARRKLADHAAAQLVAGVAPSVVMQELAAYLLDAGRTREQNLIVRDIERLLAVRGAVVARVTTARPLTTAAEAEITSLVQREYGEDTTVTIVPVIDESIIGGMRLELPDKQLDSSVKTKLDTLTI